MAGDKRLSDVLSEFARTMVTDFPIQGILDRLVERIVEVMPVTAAGVTLISPGASPHQVAASDLPALAFEQLQTDLGEGPCLAAFESGEAVAVPDLRGDPRFPSFSPRAIEAGLAAVFAFPLRHGSKQRLGALDLYRDSPGDLSPESMGDAQTLADVAAAYLLNAQTRTELQHLSNKHLRAALHDALTGLPNRVLLLERLEHAFLRGQRSGRTVAVFFVDLDRFKAVNDTYGHRVGDELLVAVAKRLSGVLRPGDTLGRLAGDEFVILCEDLEDPSQAERIAARVDAALGRPYDLSDTRLDVTASVGIAFTDRATNDPDQLLHDADVAMYQAKRKGGARRQILDLREQHLAEEEASLERDLRGVSRRGELRIDYQPIVDTVSGAVLGAEALLRWEHPQRGSVAPTVLIPLAEQSGLILEIGHWVLEHAWAQHDRWRSLERADLAMSVNVSAHQLMTAGFVDSVAAVLGTTGAPARLLTLEVTESVFVRDSDRALVVLNDLKDLGVMLALDDFGTGYSSLSYLKDLPVDVVKIDRKFVADLGADSASHSIVAAVVQLAHGLGMSVVAEGVETAAQHRAVAHLRCDSCQGFYFARPMPPDALADLIRHGCARQETSTL